MGEGTYKVYAHWDEGIGAWLAYSADVPGLRVEAENIELLLAKLKEVVPELLRENHIAPSLNLGWPVTVEFPFVAVAIAGSQAH